MPKVFDLIFIYLYNIFSPSNHYQKDIREAKEPPSVVPSAVPQHHPQFSSKIDKYRKKVNEDKGEKKIKEVKKEYPKAKPKVTQVKIKLFNYQSKIKLRRLIRKKID